MPLGQRGGDQERLAEVAETRQTVRFTGGDSGATDMPEPEKRSPNTPTRHRRER